MSGSGNSWLQSGLGNLLILVLVGLLVSGVLWSLFSVSPVLAVGFAIGLGIVLLWRLSRRQSEDGDSSDSVWHAIPRWQYDGRHVESGGLTRDEQEQALQEMQEEASSLESVDNDFGDE
jgi:hypothetical protein